MSFATMLVAIFAYILVTAPTAHAADAQWSGATITYNQKQYQAILDAKAGDTHNLAPGTKIYAYIEPVTSSAGSPTKKAHLIYFAPTINPSAATSADYITYDFTSPPDTFSNPSAAKSITLDPQTSNPGTTSCDDTFTMGIGWIICPITNFLASAMDWLFGILSSFLEVRPVQTNSETPLFRAWSFMRNFANVAFVIAFLIVIYSQVTNIGLSNYGIKKILPRLILAAILVNISYWICSVAVDASNIAGYSIQDIFIGMRNSLVGTEGNSWDVVSWKSIGSFILSAGTAGVVAGIGIHVLLAGTVGAAIYMLLPVLVAVILAALIALLVLALRQALITILIILSPLAFVAFLLPNTEKFFKKWQDLFTTMLIMFPLFSIIFGGSQLAGIAIIQNADSINLVILGMAVQVAPVVVTPLLVKFSGSLIGRIAGMVNNPNKGLIDRTRNWSRGRADEHKARVLANPANRRRDGLARVAKKIDANRRKREGWKKINESFADAHWENNHEAHKIHEAAERADMLKETGEAVSHAAINRLKTTNGHRMQIGNVDLRVAKLDVDVTKAQADVQWENLRAAPSSRNIIPSHLASQALQAQLQTRESAVAARQLSSAQFEQQNDFANVLESSVGLQQRAGGIDPNGAGRALAYALSQQHKARSESITNANAIIEHSNLSGYATLDLALGHAQGSITATDDIMEAAIKKIASSGNVDAINKLIEGLDLSPTGNTHHRIALVEALKSNSARPKYVGFGKMDEITQGVAGGLGSSGVDDMIQATINDGKLSAEVLVAQDKDALVRISQAITRNRASYSQAVLDNLKKQINEVYANDILKTKVAERDQPLKDILKLI